MMDIKHFEPTGEKSNKVLKANEEIAMRVNFLKNQEKMQDMFAWYSENMDVDISSFCSNYNRKCLSINKLIKLYCLQACDIRFEDMILYYQQEDLKRKCKHLVYQITLLKKPKKHLKMIDF
jgi:hypothetical protein